MALPAHILDRLPPAVRGASSALERGLGPGLSLGLPELDAALPDGGLLRGGVVELAVSGGPSLATSIALLACRAAQQESLRQGGERAWCAFLDPSGTLYGPGIVQHGVALERLLVARPSIEALGRVALRVVQARAFAVTVIDTVGTAGCELSAQLGTWPRIVRRLSMALEGSSSQVLLITDSTSARPLPLPVAMRVELARVNSKKLMLQIAKDNRGRISRPRSIAWARPVVPALEFPHAETG